MTKWNVLMVIIMLVTIAAIGGEATHKHRHRRTWIGCFRYCSRNCSEYDGNCFEHCKIKCGGPTPPKTNSRNPHGENYTYMKETKIRLKGGTMGATAPGPVPCPNK